MHNGIVETTTRDSRFFPTSITAVNNGTTQLSLTYTYALNGNVKTPTITPPGSWHPTQTYNYDALNRIASASENGSNPWMETFHYDPYGNMWVDPVGSQYARKHTLDDRRKWHRQSSV
jgi:hypothetical protein